ncbi:hypothetical protein BDV59DRAFT_168821 [Aspergillus ambiguus]|uniref:uncharacterized protein n=1 Tax=Aspergillus ambiguus TaxID=176160 RepID=UPI003CCD4152
MTNQTGKRASTAFPSFPLLPMVSPTPYLTEYAGHHRWERVNSANSDSHPEHRRV